MLVLTDPVVGYWCQTAVLYLEKVLVGWQTYRSWEQVTYNILLQSCNEREIVINCTLRTRMHSICTAAEKIILLLELAVSASELCWPFKPSTLYIIQQVSDEFKSKNSIFHLFVKILRNKRPRLLVMWLTSLKINKKFWTQNIDPNNDLALIEYIMY